MAQKENIKIFIAYSREDQDILNRLRTNLKVLERTQNIEVWYDGKIEVGSDWEKQIKTNLYSADIILLLISENFIASDYCYNNEMTEALSLNDQNKVRTIPIIAKECLWHHMPFAQLQALPEDGKPILSKDWSTPNRPYIQVVTEIEKIAKDIRKKRNNATLNIQQEKQISAQKTQFNTILQDGNQQFQKGNWQKASVQYQQAIGLYESNFGVSLHDLQHKIQQCNQEMGYDTAFREANIAYAKTDYKSAIQKLENALQLKSTPEANQLLADAKRKLKEIQQSKINNFKNNKILRFGLPLLLLALLGIWGIPKLGGSSDNSYPSVSPIDIDSTEITTITNSDSEPTEEEIKGTPTSPDPAILAKKEYQKFLDEGDRYLRKSDYQNAKDKYLAAQKAAKGFSFSTRDAKDGIEKCESEIEKLRAEQSIKEKQDNYDKWIKQGNSNYKRGKYVTAKSGYLKALNYKETSDARQKVKDCEENIKKEKDKLNYQKALNAGNKAFQNNKDKTAKSHYQKAQTYSNTSTIRSKITACENALKPKPSKPKLPQVIVDLEKNMKKIPSGSFTMGCQDSKYKNCQSDEKPTHKVNVPSFYMNRYEVTQAQWEAVTGKNPSKFNRCSTCPVENVSWNDTQEFFKKLNKMTGKKYRLPSEAEWEYAARGGENYQYAGSNTLKSVAWYFDNSGIKTHPVGKLSPNGYGLYDMSGNVWEWCEDYYHKDYIGAPTDGSAWNTGGDKKYRVLRGGSWSNSNFDCRVAIRYGINPTNRNNDGLRCVRAH